MAVQLPKSIYIHLMKTGGWAVREAISRLRLYRGEIGRGHDPANVLGFGDKVRPFTFVFVRHPLGWYRSYWAFRMQAGWKVPRHQAITGWQTFGSVLDHECRADVFEDWLRNVLAYVPEGFLSRIYRIYSEGVDFVGKAESLERDFFEALARAGERFSREGVPGMRRRNVTDARFVAAATLRKSLAEKVLETEAYVVERFGYGSIPPSLLTTTTARPLAPESETARYQRMLDEVVRSERPVPTGLEGRGIVICGGGAKYFPCAWVCLKMLRRLGCRLPIQLWHLGREEMSPQMRRLVEALSVETVDAQAVKNDSSGWRLKGWELKPYAIIHSPFREVLLIDSDNVPTIDPEFLFETRQYRRAGAIFWPDYGRLGRDRRIWEICRVRYRNEPEFESGQIVVDKQRCWKALQVTLHLNEQSDFYYEHVHGDKETFHMAFRRVGQKYAMPAKGIRMLEATMCQHDFDGRIIFQHRNLDKWSLDGNRRIVGFQFESECLGFLEELRRLWDGRIPRFTLASKTRNEREAIKALTRGKFLYHRVGYDSRPMRFMGDGTVGEGGARMEEFWDLAEHEGKLYLDLRSQQELTCRLEQCPAGIWRGRWMRFEQMPIEISRIKNGSKRSRAA